MAVDIGEKIDALHEELMLIRARLETLEEMLTEEKASEDDKVALEEALEGHERGETIALDEALRKLK
jgi:lipid II:glycine glycyltransferase (peptidoglycan interpeptide bridge formation enzyme)